MIKLSDCSAKKIWFANQGQIIRQLKAGCKTIFTLLPGGIKVFLNIHSIQLHRQSGRLFFYVGNREGKYIMTVNNRNAVYIHFAGNGQHGLVISLRPGSCPQ
jgi:hypothetical protein